MKRYDGLDILKAICSFLVVCIHAPFGGIFGEYVIAVSRIAVPIFFMITGYFYNNTVIKNNQSNQIKRILILVISEKGIFI